MLLIAALSHGWLLVIAALVLTVIAYVTTILLVSIFKSGDDNTEF